MSSAPIRKGSIEHKALQLRYIGFSSVWRTTPERRHKRKLQKLARKIRRLHA